MALVHHEIADDARLGEKRLDRSLADVCEIDLGVANIRGFSVQFRGLQILNRRILRGKLFRREDLEIAVIRLEVMNIRVRCLEIGDRGILQIRDVSRQHLCIDVLDLSILRR